jgi:hypothetical protein
MTGTNEIERLKAEIEYLKGEVANLYHLLGKEVHSSSRHIQVLYKRVKKVNKYSNDAIANLYDMVSPIEEKLFPGVSKARQKLTDIVESSEQDFDDDANSDPSSGDQDKKNP